MLEHAMTVAQNTDDMQFGYMPSKSTMDVICDKIIARSVSRAKDKKVYFGFVQFGKGI